MSTTTEIASSRVQRTLADVLRDAHALPRQDRARLIGLLADDLVTPPTATASASLNGAAIRAAWERVDTFAEAFRADFPDADVSAQIDTDRHERDAVLMIRRLP